MTTHQKEETPSTAAPDPGAGAGATTPTSKLVWVDGQSGVLAETRHESVLQRYLGAYLLRLKSGWARVLLSDLIVGLLGIPAALLMWLVRPWLLIRIAPVHSERIGHFAANTEIYLCQKEVGLDVPPQRYVDVFYYDTKVSNAQLQRMWNRVLPVSPLDLRLLNFFVRRLPRGADHCFRTTRSRDVHCLLDRTKPHLSFTPGEEAAGQAGLAALGLPPGARFICFVARDPAYLVTYMREHNPGLDWSYHDYRNCDINSYLPGVRQLVGEGAYAVRVGSVTEQELEVSDPKIIDYANSGKRTEFMDIYLAAKCDFFLSCGTGIDQVAMIFRRPMLFVNFAQLEGSNTWSSDHLFIPKKAWLRREQRFMTFPEILEPGAGRFVRSAQFVEPGIELIENTPEEIAAVVTEMDQRLRGVWRETAENIELQLRFWALFQPSDLNREFRSRIGTEFLRRNRDLLD